MRLSKPIGIGLVLLAAQISAFSAEVAVLRNGFSIRFERKEQTGNTTRLFTKSGFVDVPSANIESFEPDETPAEPSTPASQPSAQNSSTPQPQPGAVQPAALQPGVLQANTAQFNSTRFNTTQTNVTQPNAVSVSSAPARTTPVPANISRLDLDQVVREASSRYRIDPDFVTSVIKAESNFQSRAVSRKGAQGLMQLMPGTASKLGVINAFDPKANVEGGTAHLSQLLDLYNNDAVKALAAYNAGAHRVAQYHGVPPYLETQAYVARIVRDFNAKKRAQTKAAAIPAGKAKLAKPASKKARTPAQPQEASVTHPRKPA